MVTEEGPCAFIVRPAAVGAWRAKLTCAEAAAWSKPIHSTLKEQGRCGSLPLASASTPAIFTVPLLPLGAAGAAAAAPAVRNMPALAVVTPSARSAALVVVVRIIGTPRFV